MESKIPKRIRVTSSSNGYVTSKIFSDYISEFYQNVKLVYPDLCSTHKAESVTIFYHENNNLHVSIPSNCTKYIQPLDVCIFKSFKAKLDAFKRYTLEKMRKIERNLAILKSK